MNTIVIIIMKDVIVEDEFLEHDNHLKDKKIFLNLQLAYFPSISLGYAATFMSPAQWLILSNGKLLRTVKRAHVCVL